MHSNISKNSGNTNKAKSWNSSFVWELGNSDNSPPSTDVKDPPVQIKPEDWVTEENKDSLSTESESEEEEEKEESEVVFPTVNQSSLVSTILKLTLTSDLLLSAELVKNSVDLVFWTLTGLPKTLLINIMSVLWLILLIPLLKMIQELTGFATPLIKEDNSEDSPQLEDHTEVSEEKVTEPQKQDLLVEETGKEEIFVD